MKTFSKLAALAALALLSTAAQADTICSNCGQYTPPNFNYLGGHWRGDRSTIIGTASGVYVLDVNENALLTVNVSGNGIRPLVVSIHSVVEDDCGVEIGAACGLVMSWPLVEKVGKVVRKRVVAGRYVIFVDNVGDGSTYSGTITVGARK